MTHLTLGNLQVVETGTSTFLQLNLTANSDGWVTLRALETPDKTLITCLGILANNQWYFVQDLLEGLASDAYTFSVDAPLPKPAVPNWGVLSPAAIEFATRGVLGGTFGEICDALGGPDAYQAALGECRDADLTPVKAGVIKPLWDAVTQASKDKATARATAPKPLYVEPSKTATVDPTTIVYNVPRTLSQDQMDNVARRVAVRDTQRMKWPFASMAVGQSVFIEAKLAVRGQRAAHAYGAAIGAVFITHRLTNGDLEVIRTKEVRPTRASKKGI